MRNARVTVLMRPDEKAALEKKAADRGVSSGEYLRLAVDNFEKLSDEQESELAALAEELKAALPKMKASLDRSCKVLHDLHQENDEFFKARGVR
jgi:hypothetical protein